MIFSKSNLLSVEITQADKSLPVLDNLHFRTDGSTVAASGSAILAVSPVNERERAAVPIDSSSMAEDETVNRETVREVLKSMPRDTMFGGILEHCDYSNGRFVLTDGKRTRTISAKTYQNDYIDYRGVFRRAAESRVIHREAVNLRRFVDLLNVIDKMFPDSSKNSAVFLEFTEGKDIVVRAYDVRGRQQCIGVMKAYDGAEGKWPEKNEWEIRLCDSQENVSVRKITKKKRLPS